MEDGAYMSDLYPARVDRLVKAGGYFLITCGYSERFIDAFSIFSPRLACNFTEEELKAHFDNEGTRLRYQWEALNGFLVR